MSTAFCNTVDYMLKRPLFVRINAPYRAQHFINARALNRDNLWYFRTPMTMGEQKPFL